MEGGSDFIDFELEVIGRVGSDGLFLELFDAVVGIFLELRHQAVPQVELLLFNFGHE